MAALDLLGRRWTLRVLWELHHASAGFRDLQSRCDGMSSSVLATRIRELTEAGLVVGGTEGYQLTKLGRDLVDAMLPLSRWADRWERTLRR